MAKRPASPKAKKSTQPQAKPVAPPRLAKPARADIAAGDKVTHKLFGVGKVIALRGDILSIQFGRTVTKEILVDFVAPV